MPLHRFGAEAFCIYIIGIADKMKSVGLVQIFCPVKETNRTHSKGYVEDLRAESGQKRCAKMARPNLSVIPIFDFDLIRYVLVLVHKTLFNRLPDIFFRRIVALFPVNVVTDFPVGDDDNFFSLIYMFSVSCTRMRLQSIYHDDLTSVVIFPLSSC